MASGEVIRNGQTMSVINIRPGDIVLKRFGGGGGGGGSSSPPVFKEPEVYIRGETIFINGQGFSVPLQNQAYFIQQQTGGVGTSAQREIRNARLREELRQRQAQEEKGKIENLKRELERRKFQETTQILRNREGQRVKVNIIKNNNQDTRVIIRTNLDTGEKTYQSFEKIKGYGSTKTREVSEDTSQQKELQKELPMGVTVIKPTIKERLTTAVLNLQSKFDSNIANNKRLIRNFASKKEVTRLKELTKKKNLTDSEKNEVSRIRRDISKNSNVISDFIISIIGKSLIDLGVGSVTLLNQLRKDPYKTIISLPPAIYQGVKQDINIFRTGDILEKVQLVVEYTTYSKALKGVSRVAKSSFRILRKLSPSYVSAKGEQFVLRSKPKEIFKVRGAERYLKSRTLPPSFKRPFSSISDFLSGRKAGQFKKFTIDPGLILKKSTVASGSSKLSAQVRLAGKQVTAVNASAQQLTSWLRRKKIIRKPIPGEELFPARIKRIINKFDRGIKLTNREFAEVNLWLQKNVAPNITLLERSLYLDPKSGLRISRLGIQSEKRATLRDILKGNFRIFPSPLQPQVLIFENAKIAQFPKYLNTIKRKLLADKPLTVAETNKLIRWQVQTGGGKFKPIGSTIYSGGRELEVTLAPGEYIKRITQIGFTYIEGKKVTFVTAKIFRPSKKLANQIRLANAGKLSKKQVFSLEKNLSKSLGRKIRIETPSLRKLDLRSIRRMNSSIPILRISPRGIFVSMFRRIREVGGRTGGRVTPRGGRTRGKVNGRTTPRATRGRTRGKVNGRTTSKGREGRTTGRITPRSGRTKGRIGGRVTPRGGRITPPIIPRLIRNFKRKKLRKSQPVFYVKIKRRGKVINLTPRPLTLRDAKDFLAYSVDNGLERTAWFEPLGRAKRVVSLPKKIKGYFSRNSRKLRPFRIRRGNKKAIRMGYIEKRKFFSDTPREKAQLRGTRRKQKRRFINRYKPTRKRYAPSNRLRKRANFISRNIMLNNLRRARMIRMRNLRKLKRIHRRRR